MRLIAEDTSISRVPKFWKDEKINWVPDIVVKAIRGGDLPYMVDFSVIFSYTIFILLTINTLRRISRGPFSIKKITQMRWPVKCWHRCTLLVAQWVTWMMCCWSHTEYMARALKELSVTDVDTQDAIWISHSFSCSHWFLVISDQQCTCSYGERDACIRCTLVTGHTAVRASIIEWHKQV
jgi:hypothetical protein